MRKFDLRRLAVCLPILFAGLSVGCNTEDVDPEVPMLEIAETLTGPAAPELTLNLGEGEGEATFAIRSNRHWKITVPESAGWVVTSPEEGDGDQQVTVQVTANTGIGRRAVLVVSNQLLSKSVIVSQSGTGGSLTVIYEDNLDKKPAEKNAEGYWPYVSDFDGWNIKGPGSGDVTYTGNNASVRNNLSSGVYDGASGLNNILLGAAGNYFQINKVALTSAETNLQLTFGCIRNLVNAPDNAFNPSELIVELSSSGQEGTWHPLTYQRAATDTWGMATADFTLTEAPAFLYIRFHATILSSIRLDDFRLQTGNGGQTIDLNSGVTPPPTPGELIYSDNFGTTAVVDAQKHWPWVKDFTGWDPQGPGAPQVTYSGTNSTVRANAESSGYEGASGKDNIFFGATPSDFIIQNITLQSDQTKLHLTFGCIKNVYQGTDNDFNTAELTLYLSPDGQEGTWKQITYQRAATSEWGLATSDFTLTQPTAKLYIKFISPTVPSAIRIDDVALRTGEGGQEVTFDGSTPPPSGDYLFRETFGSTAEKDKDGFWPSISAYTGYSHEGTAYVAGTTTYSGQNASVRQNTQGSGTDAGFSGVDHVWFTNTGGYFEVEKLVLQSDQTKLRITFGVYGNGVVYNQTENQLSVLLSANGTNWSAPLTFETSTPTTAGDHKWTLVTVDFTLTKAVENLYIKINGTSMRLDDVILNPGEGGQSVTLDQSSAEAELVPISKIWSEYASRVPNNKDKVTITDNWKIKGTVVSYKAPTANSSNIEDFLFAMEDATTPHSGIAVNLTGHNFAPNDVVEVELNGQTITNFQGLLQLSATSVQKSGTTDVQPVVVIPSDLSQYQSMLVRINTSETKSVETGNWYDADNKGNHTMVTRTNAEYLMYFKSKAAFAVNNPVVNQSGFVIGLGGIYNTNVQLQPRMLSDLAGLTEPRFTPGEGAELTVTTTYPTTIGSTSVTLLGAYDGGTAAPTEVGFMYREFGAANFTQAIVTPVTASFTKELTGLKAETQYEYYAYAVADGSTVEGNRVTFVTTADTPAGAAITIPQLIAMAGETAAVIDATQNRTLEAVVVTDFAGGNFTFNNLLLMTPGATTAGNGITVFNNPLNKDGQLTAGDRVTLTLPAGMAKIQLYKGSYQITGVTDADFTKGARETITPIVITPSQLTAFQNMPVSIEHAQSVNTSGKWSGTQAFTVNGDMATLFNVYVKSTAPLATENLKTGNGVVRGIAQVYNGKAQLVPRSAEDVAGLTGERIQTGGDAPTPTFAIDTASMVAGRTSATPLTFNNYNASNDKSAPYTWQQNGVAFAGFKVCKANQDRIGCIQGQGNDSDENKQMLLYNTTSIAGLKTLTVSLYADTEFAVYGGTAAGERSEAITAREAMNDKGQLTKVYDFSGKNYTYFTIVNNTGGALYMWSVGVINQ